jgi:class 3 adenylate cyclase/tetratricopeptide (TPR) repeat protein
MQCVSCGTTLLAGKKFCHACGTRVAQRCGGCGATLSAEFRFCPDCGLQVSDGADGVPPSPAADPLARLSRFIPAGLEQKIRATQGEIAGERKQVTVLFCDLAGSTAIAEGLDPEVYHDLLDQYLERAFAEIYRYEGLVNQLAGDGLMALFGAPVAHEDAPRRALLAALGIHAALIPLGDELRAQHGIELRARIGVHTGPVVVGTVGNDLKMDYTAIGDTTNLAARLEALATPGSTLISEATHRLVRGFFQVRETGPLEVKGKAEPVVAFELLGTSDAQTPMAIAAARGLTPFVGRLDDLAALEHAYQRLTGGQGHMVAIVGDAGMGKSRLLYEAGQFAGDSTVFFLGRCSSLTHAVPYAPFVNMLRSYFGLLPGESPAFARRKVAAKLGKCDDWLESKYPVLGRFLAVPGAEADLPAGALKREVLEAISRLILSESTRAPVIVGVEDVHWIDDASRELLDALVLRLATAPVLVVVSHRPDEHLRWGGQMPFSQIVLQRLGDDEIRSMLHSIIGVLPDSLERQLVAKSEGSPFYAEEIARALIEEGHLVRDNGTYRLTRPPEQIPIPGTIQEVIAARLDRLGPRAKRVIQVASVLGRQFTATQLAQVLDGEDIDVAQELDEAERRGLVHRKSLLAGDEFRFGESLTQEIAYEGLLLKQRRVLHERVGILLEATASDGGAERAAMLAHHYARSDNRPKALEALLAAAEATERLPSYRVAAAYYRRAWDLAEAALLESPDDEALRRAALQATSAVCRLTVLFSVPDDDGIADRAASRGVELAEALGETATLAGLYYFQGVNGITGGREAYTRGLALAEKGLALAQREGLTLSTISISRGLCVHYMLDGRFDIAQRAIAWTIAELEALGQREQVTDLYLGCRYVQAIVLYGSDEFDEVIANATETHRLATSVNNRTVSSGCAGVLAHVHFLRGEYEEARRWAEGALEIAEAIENFAAMPSHATIAYLASVALGEPVETTEYFVHIESALTAPAWGHVNARFVSEALIAGGDLRRAERYLDQLRLTRGGRLREALAELEAGDVLRHLGPERWDEAERAYGDAIAMAESLQAGSVLAAAALGSAELAATRGDRTASARQLARAEGLVRALRLDHYNGRIARLRSGSIEAPAGAQGRT